MSKGWTTVFTNKDESPSTSTKTQKHFENTIRNTKSLTIDKLKAEGDIAYAEKIAKEDNLLAAFDNKILKSKSAIKQAIRIKKEREAAAKKQEEKKAEASTEVA